MKDDYIKSTVEFSTEWTLYKMPFLAYMVKVPNTYRKKNELSFDIAEVSGANYEYFSSNQRPMLCAQDSRIARGKMLPVATKEAILP